MIAVASNAAAAAPLYLLDTNVLIHAVRGSPTWQRIKAACDPLLTEPRPIVSIVSHGELRSFAEQQEWGALKRDQALFLLGYFARAGIDAPDVLDAYALMDTYSRRNGIKMGKNDLWIAATAHVTGAVLVTTDRDFEHLHGLLLTRLLIEPALQA